MTKTKSVPEVDEVFKLTMDADKIDPAYGLGKDWQFIGPQLRGIQTIKAKLIQELGQDFDEIKQEVAKQGYRLLEGQWAETFRQKFPNVKTNQSHIMFGGSEWLSNLKRRQIAYLQADLSVDNRLLASRNRDWRLNIDDLPGHWCIYFMWSGETICDSWLWAVTKIK